MALMHRIETKTGILVFMVITLVIFVVTILGLSIATIAKITPLSSPATTDSGVFEFAAMGDTGYLEPQMPDVEKMFLEMNSQKLDFTIHVGDIRGSYNCTDASFERMKAIFNTSEFPLIYEIGDNEWMDCWLVLDHTGQNFPSPQYEADQELANPIKALARIRKMFYPDSWSLGKKKIKLVRQSDHGDVSSTTFNESDFREHQLWTHKGVVFSTLHVEGNGNSFFRNNFGLTMPDEFFNQTTAEYLLRQQAVTAWMDKTFDTAKLSNALGIVLAMQANPQFHVRTADRPAQYPGYLKFHEDLLRNVKNYDKPVLLVHGDSHFFTVDKPFTRFSVYPPLFLNGTEIWPAKYAEDFTRVEVPGADHVGWVRIRVNPENPDLFEPLYGRVPQSKKIAREPHIHVGFDNYN